MENWKKYKSQRDDKDGQKSLIPLMKCLNN